MVGRGKLISLRIHCTMSYIYLIAIEHVSKGSHDIHVHCIQTGSQNKSR